MDTNQIVARLEARAKKLGMSMAALCGTAKVAQSTITRWKSGAYDPRYKVLKRLEDALGEAEALRSQARKKQPKRERPAATQG
jgi:predicted transcriptional regulator